MIYKWGQEEWHHRFKLLIVPRWISRQDTLPIVSRHNKTMKMRWETSKLLVVYIQAYDILQLFKCYCNLPVAALPTNWSPPEPTKMYLFWTFPRLQPARSQIDTDWGPPGLFDNAVATPLRKEWDPMSRIDSPIDNISSSYCLQVRFSHWANFSFTSGPKTSGVVDLIGRPLVKTRIARLLTNVIRPWI